MNGQIRYVAEPRNVREVSMRGTADLSYWQHRFKLSRLAPVMSKGRAQILIISAQMRFMGLRFSELSISVFVSDRSRPDRADSVFLVQAFNTQRAFAFCERALFSTPYQHGIVKVGHQLPVSVQLETTRFGSLRAEMGANPSDSPRVPSRSDDEGWSGRVFLPNRGSNPFDSRRYFHAKTTGRAHVYAFDSQVDTLLHDSLPPGSPLLPLRDSGFEVDEWIVREDAIHGKSRTFRLTAERTGLDQGA